jgi:hypothetical protein
MILLDLDRFSVKQVFAVLPQTDVCFIVQLQLDWLFTTLLLAAQH